jgi:O-antigen/teichoic acid export membrane protein
MKFVIYTGFCSSYIITLLLSPPFLSAEQIGITRLLISITISFSAFAALGVGQMCSRIISYFKDNKEEREMFLFFVLLISLAGLLFVEMVFFVLQNTIISTYSSKAKLIIRDL